MPIKLCNIKEALRLVNATRIKSLVDLTEKDVSNESEIALLYVYKTILSKYDTENHGNIGHGSNMLDHGISNDQDVNITATVTFKAEEESEITQHQVSSPFNPFDEREDDVPVADEVLFDLSAT